MRRSFPHSSSAGQQLEETVASLPAPPPFTLRQRPEDPTLRSKLADQAVTSFPRALDAHVVSAPIAAGGMASVHLAASPDPHHRIVAIKRLHPHLATEACFTQMLLDEAAVASRIRHRNVIKTYGADVIGHEVVLVMEYVSGLALHVVLQRAYPKGLPARIAAAILAGALRGLHAAHEAVDANHRPLRIVHRDVSPQNILIGRDGVPRILDFGVALSDQRNHRTEVGDIKGKLAYMSPEQVRGVTVDRRTDIYAAGVVLWEALVGAPLFHGDSEGNTIARVLAGSATPPGSRVDGVPAALDAVVLRALAPQRADRFGTAREMAEALDAVFESEPVTRTELRDWVRALGGEVFRKQAQTAGDLRRRATPLSAEATLHAPLVARTPPPMPPPPPSPSPSRPPPPPPPPPPDLAALSGLFLDALRGRIGVFAAIFIAALTWGLTEGAVASAVFRGP